MWPSSFKLTMPIGEVSGYLVRSMGAPTVYFPSDTIMTEDVRDVIETAKPDIIVTNSGGAFSQGLYGPIIMDDKQTVEVLKTAPWAKIIAIHLDTTDHCQVTRESLKDFVRDTAPQHLDRLHIPADGGRINFRELVQA